MLLTVGGILLFLAGCETTREITIGADGRGSVVTITDMSSLIGMAKMSGKSDELDKLGDEAIDTTISLAAMVDSIPDLTVEEKALVRSGTMGLNMDMKNEKFIARLQFPFTDPAQISHFDKLTSKVMTQVMKGKMGEGGDAEAGLPGGGAEGGGGLFGGASIDEYFTYTYSKGLIERKLNKDKYAHIDEDQGMQTMKQMASMGMGNNTIIINLPAPAKKAEGTNVTLSDDKRKVTIKTEMDGFFEDGASQEFRIEY